MTALIIFIIPAKIKGKSYSAFAFKPYCSTIFLPCAGFTGNRGLKSFEKIGFYFMELFTKYEEPYNI